MDDECTINCPGCALCGGDTWPAIDQDNTLPPLADVCTCGGKGLGPMRGDHWTCAYCCGVIKDDDDPTHDTDGDEDRCPNCSGPHHVQKCPEILSALFAPFTGAEIAQAWHRNYKGFARRIIRKPASERIHAAFLYSRYMAERLPKQRYALTIENTLVAWHRAAA